jgi:hypothetical protein
MSTHTEAPEFTYYATASGWVVWDHIADGQVSVDGLTETEAKELADLLNR